jgi:hypothetical protein
MAKRSFCGASAILLLITVAVLPASSAVPGGTWMFTNRVALQIFDCSGLLCGKIVWLLRPENSAGQTTIILNHVGGPLGIGPYKDKKAETFAQWKAGIIEVAKSQNVVVKLGGLGMPIGMFDFYTREKPPSSEELAPAYAAPRRRPFSTSLRSAPSARLTSPRPTASARRSS